MDVWNSVFASDCADSCIISEHRIVLCNTGRMTEAVLFSAKQAVHESERSLPAFSFFFFRIDNRAEAFHRRWRRYNLERILILQFRIHRNEFLTALRNYYHGRGPSCGWRGFAGCSSVSNSGSSFKSSYWLTTRRKGDVENAKQKTEKEWQYTCIRVHPVAYRDWSEASPENVCTFCPSISSKRIQQVKSMHISFSFFFFVIRFLLREFFFFSIQSSLNECRAVSINHDTRSSHMSLHPHNLLSFVIRYDYIWREIIIPLSAWSKINRHSLACFFNYDYNKYSPFNNSIGRKSKFVKLLL